MKKIIIITVLALASFANAQKGTILLMGSAGFESTKTEVSATPDKVNVFNINPKIGYQFKDHWTAGLDLAFTTSKTEETVEVGIPNFFSLNATQETKTTSFGVGPFIRYTKPISEMFSFYGDLTAGFQSTKTTIETSNLGPIPTGATQTEQKGSGFYASLVPAIYLQVKKGFGLNFNIGGLRYESVSFNNNAGDNNRFDFNFGQAVNIGLSRNF